MLRLTSAFGHLGVIWLAQAVLLEQRINLVRSPEVVVNLAGLCPADRGKFD